MVTLVLTLRHHDNVVHLQPFSFAAREYLRPMLVGKLVQYNVTHTVEGSKTGSNVRTLLEDLV